MNASELKEKSIEDPGGLRVLPPSRLPYPESDRTCGQREQWKVCGPSNSRFFTGEGERIGNTASDNRFVSIRSRRTKRKTRQHIRRRWRGIHE